MLRLSDLDYAYPDDLVAQHPCKPRDHARLMVVDRATGAIEHRRFDDLPGYFAPGAVMVVNDTRVFPARLFGTKDGTGARVEVFLLRELNPERFLWEALVAPARKLRIGNHIHFEGDLTAEVLDTTNARGRAIRFDFHGTPEELHARLDAIGGTPLPPYIKRDADDDDIEDYQTIFAEHRGAVAAPTAGLHFTPDLLRRVKAAGAAVAPITLHVGIGTFKMIEVEDVAKHQMDGETFVIPDATARCVDAARAAGHPVTAIGTTSVRALEANVLPNGHLHAGAGWTDKFIHPPYTFRAVDRLVTNFHMPRSSLLLLVSAFAGHALTKEAYRIAVEERYRLFSYGDAMLIL